MRRYSHVSNHITTILALIAGLVFAYILLKTPADLWLIIVIALLLTQLSFWQVKRIGVHLIGDKPEKNNKRASNPIHYWFSRLFVFFILVFIGLFAESLWWSQQQIQYSREKSKRTLPYSSAWQKMQWQMGIATLPKLIEIPAGSFQMGSDDDSNEQPIHTVNIKKFWMSQTEISFKQYDYYVWQLKRSGISAVSYPDDEQWGRETRPVINVSWHDAQDYINWLSHKTGQQCRLPSEAEWEYAARGGSTTKYPWGDEASHEFANYGKDKCCDGLAKGNDKWLNTSPVASFPANAFGLFDMQGNVYEWVEDKWHDNYKGAPNNGRAWLEGDSTSRVLRGGSWVSSPFNLRSAFRGNNAPDTRYFSIGFRIVCSPPFIEN